MPGTGVTALWVDGALVDPAGRHVSALDHGLLVGDGVFETLKVVGGSPFAASRHLERLRRSADALGLALPADAVLRSAIDEVVAAAGLGDVPGRLRVTVTGGPGPLASARGEAPPTVVVALGPLQPQPPTATVVVVPWPRNERGALAGVKTTSYAENVRALAAATAAGADEALFGNLAGNLCEGTGTNVVVALGGRLVTPPLSSGCLAGVTRALVLERCDVEEADVPLTALPSVSEACLVSTTRGAQPIAAVDGRPLPVPGPLTADVTAMLQLVEREEADP
jgi:branched-chain amino acid aminotransferase